MNAATPSFTEAGVPARSQQFYETLGAVQGELESSGVDFRVLGSVAAHAWLRDGPYGAATALDFDRPGAHTPDQRVPDIDLLLPREAVKRGQELRTEYLRRELPVKLGVAIGVNVFDFRPDQPTSYLTHKQMANGFATSTFAARTVQLGGVNVRTLDPNALHHTFVTTGGLLRAKDWPLAKGLAELAAGERAQHDEKFGVFHHFIQERDQRYPAERRSSAVREVAKRHLPPKAYNFAMNQALKAASALGRR